jgi:hypothetical protein
MTPIQGVGTPMSDITPIPGLTPIPRSIPIFTRRYRRHSQARRRATPHPRPPTHRSSGHRFRRLRNRAGDSLRHRLTWDTMGKWRRGWRAALIAAIGTAALSSCYYDAYTGYWRPYPAYYPNLGYYPFPWAIPPPYSAYFASPPPQTNLSPGPVPPADAPVQRAPLLPSP